ncbi:hypothetical protein F5Y15DRAFT_345039 [Xylariaceae sp. FL0016]|nr:hypothetical protein F5Y15DRAFT_345039 [Xylariaceae sp. FL0016]
MALPFWWDDYANFAAMALCIVYTVYIVKTKDIGLGTDIWAVPQQNLTTQLMAYHITAMAYTFDRFFIRLSIVLFYKRIFRIPQAERIILGTLIAVILTSVPIIIAALTWCTPIQHIWLKWDGEHHGGRCIDYTAFLYVAWIIFIVVDLWIIWIPIPLVAKLQISTKKKCLVSIMFCTGLLVIAISVYKIKLVHIYTTGKNFPIDVIDMIIWAGLELDLGVICACMPSIPALFGSLMQRLKSTIASSPSSSRFTGPKSERGKGSTSENVMPLRTHGYNQAVAGDSHILKVTTIHQTNGLSRYDSYQQIDDDIAIEMGDIVQASWKAQAWS